MTLPELEKICQDNGYGFPALTPEGLAVAISRQFVTVGIIVIVDEHSVGRRYCYQDAVDALVNHKLWVAEGGDHPKGPWVKIKGTFNGKYVNHTQEQLFNGLPCDDERHR